MHHRGPLEKRPHVVELLNLVAEGNAHQTDRRHEGWQAVVRFLRPTQGHLRVDGSYLRTAGGVGVDLERPEEQPLLGIEADMPATQRKAVLIQRRARGAVDLVLRFLIVDDPVDLGERGHAEERVLSLLPLLFERRLQFFDGRTLPRELGAEPFVRRGSRDRRRGQRWVLGARAGGEGRHREHAEDRQEAHETTD